MKTYYVTSERRLEPIFREMPEGEAETIRFDLTPWEEDNGTVTTATWTVKSGQASVSGAALTSSIASALVTASQSGKSRIEVSFTDGTETTVRNIFIIAREPTLYRTIDYGLVI